MVGPTKTFEILDKIFDHSNSNSPNKPIKYLTSNLFFDLNEICNTKKDYYEIKNFLKNNNLRLNDINLKQISDQNIKILNDKLYKMMKNITKEILHIVKGQNNEIQTLIFDPSCIQVHKNKVKLFIKWTYDYIIKQSYNINEQVNGVKYNGVQLLNDIKIFWKKYLDKYNRINHIIIKAMEDNKIQWKNKINNNNSNEMSANSPNFTCLNWYKEHSNLISHQDSNKRFDSNKEINIFNLISNFSITYGNSLSLTYDKPILEEFVPENGLYSMEPNCFVRDELPHNVQSSRVPNERIALILRTILPSIVNETKDKHINGLKKLLLNLCNQINNN